MQFDFVYFKMHYLIDVKKDFHNPSLEYYVGFSKYN